jgi:DNA-binding NtrC family response regulator
MESELFGHEKGAFTGAVTRQRGIVELARAGTLFLDEIAEMALHLQAKLLRFLQDGSFRRLGAETELCSRCRIVGATLTDLEALQAKGLFRPDLYYRLAVVRLQLPPLRERREDLLPFAHFLLEQTSARLGRPLRPLSPQGEEALVQYHWPGNVRELANRLERATVLGHDPQLGPADLDLEPGSSAPHAPQQVLGDPHRLRLLLEEEGWNISRTARRLGVERHRLKYRVQKLGLTRMDNK